MNRDSEVDVLVVGAGSAGAATALLFATRGVRVALVDKRARGETGARWVNAVPAWCFDEATIARPTGDEAPLGVEPHNVHLVGPTRRTKIELREVPMIHVDMRRLVARLVDEAERAGVAVSHGGVDAVEVVGDRARSVSFVDGRERFTLRARLIVDATGIRGAIRGRVPGLAAECSEVRGVERCAAAQFQHEVTDPERLRAVLARHGVRPGDGLGFSGIAGGYSTLTLFTHKDLREVGVLTGSIPALGVPNGLELYERFIASVPWLGRPLFGGAGAIPLRRPYTTLGAHGVALVGDAACQVYASHGSGVGMGLLAARALVDAAAHEHDLGGDTGLRRYAAAYRRAHGGLLAASEAFRRFLQGVGPAELDSLLEAGLVDPTMARAALSQRPTRPDAQFAMRAPFRAMRARSAAAKFLPLALRTVVLESLGPLTAERAIDRWAGQLIGRAAERAHAHEWSLPDLA